MRATRENANRSVLGLLGLVVVVGAAAWWACGDSSSPDEGCNPPCSAGQVCIEGVCFVAVDGGGDADAEPEADADPEAVEETTEVAEEDAAPESDFTPVDGTDADARPDSTGPSNVGEACAGDGDCYGPGEATCMTTVALPIIGGIDFPGGYCTSTCDGADPTSCGDGAICINLSFVGWVGCFQTCAVGTPGECRESEGYTCFDPASMPYLPIPSPVCIPNFGP